jgi:alpha-L-rhamnosidase
MYKLLTSVLLLITVQGALFAQLPFKTNREVRSPETVTRYFSAEKIIWQNSTKDHEIKNLGRLLKAGNGQADLANKDMCVLKSTKTFKPGFLLDFGKEIHGGIQIVTGMYPGNKTVKLRIRFGESVTEAMSDIEPNQNATNDHAMRDMIVDVPWLGVFEVGYTGYRFVRIDVVEADVHFQLKEVNAAFIFRDIPYLGSFNSSDTLLNKIWETGAYTVHLNMQDYLWDGIKRDRLVWVGDMHPEVSTIMAVFGNNNVVPKSLDLSRDIAPIPQWMNGISTYSMWWIIIHRDWYYHNGDLNYLKDQREYLLQLLPHLISKIGSDNKETLDGNRFLDWPSSENKKGVDAGLQAMMIWALTAGAEICDFIGEPKMAMESREGVKRLKKYIPEPNQSKQAAALMSLADLWPAKKANDEVIAKDGVKDFSTFYGYYMLQAMAKAGDYQGAIDAIRTYWGAMLNLGATTFWEDFNMEWVKDAQRIDELSIPGKKDIHGDFGAYCYVGFRHSLCHGWASGPTPWLTEHVLGISVMEPGGKTIRVVPNLGDLQFAEGTFPLPQGLVKVRHEKLKDGSVKTEIDAPAGVEVMRI